MPSLSPKTVGGLIRHARETAGLTQAELAEAADVSDETVRRIELGSYEPSLSTTVAIAEALRVSVESLIGRAPDAAPVDRLTPLGERLAIESAKLSVPAQRALLGLIGTLAGGGGESLGAVSIAEAVPSAETDRGRESQRTLRPGTGRTASRRKRHRKG